MSTKHCIPLLLLVAIPIAACERDDGDFDDAPESEQSLEGPEAAPAPPAPLQAPTPAEEDVAARQIEVTNPMSHPMIVTATVDGETVELGTVPADETADFTVEASSGATIQLEARDQPDSHRVRGTVTVGEAAARWTIRN